MAEITHASLVGNSGIAAGTLVLGLAHDFASPLNAIAMNAEAAKLLIERNEAARAANKLTNLIADCARCGQLLQSYRRFGAALQRSVTGGEATSIAQLVDDAAALLKGEGAKGPAVEVEGAATALYLDRIALAHAFAELLRNAADAGATTMRVVVGERGAAVTADFFDNGAGIAANAHARMMQPFFTTRRAEGRAGLGLNMALELLRANGGTLEVGSAPADGACLRVSFARPATD